MRQSATGMLKGARLCERSRQAPSSFRVETITAVYAAAVSDFSRNWVKFAFTDNVLISRPGLAAELWCLHFDPPFVPPSFSTDGKRQYRLYFLDGVGHISKLHEFFAEDDADAIRIAEGWRESRAMELWCRDRKVRRWALD